MLASREVHRESTQCCHWHWDTLLLVASKHRGLQDNKDPGGRVGFALHIFGGPGLKYLEGGWGRSLQCGTTTNACPGAQLR